MVLDESRPLRALQFVVRLAEPVNAVIGAAVPFSSVEPAIHNRFRKECRFDFDGPHHLLFDEVPQSGSQNLCRPCRLGLG